MKMNGNCMGNGNDGNTGLIKIFILITDAPLKYKI